MVRPTHGSEHVHRHPEDRQRTISELLAAGTNSDTKIPVALMESVYEGPAKPEPKRKLTKKAVAKAKKSAGTRRLVSMPSAATVSPIENS